MLDSYRWLAGVLRGESSGAAGEAVPPTGTPATRWRCSTRIVTRAVAAAIFGDPAGLARHTAAAMPLLPAAPGSIRPRWPTCCAGWPSPGRPAPADGDERDALLAELDEVTRWLAARAADAPENFLHLLRLVEAERAWAVGDFRAAALAFDAARREVAGRSGRGTGP